ncbi:MAG: hypothetical protein ACTSYU_01800 [Promethearchaeota archaeon]
MPRNKDEKKYAYARTLLEQGWSIRKVQEELKRIFKSGTSPNILTKMGKKIQQEKGIQNKYDRSQEREQSFKSFGNKLTAAELSNIAETFTITTNKFSEQMEAQNILIKSLIDKTQTTQTVIAPANEDPLSEELFHDNFDISQPSEDQIEFQLSEWEKQLLEILAPRPQNIDYIDKKMSILGELVIRCLNHLEKSNRIEIFEKNGIKTYRLIDSAS